MVDGKSAYEGATTSDNKMQWFKAKGSGALPDFIAGRRKALLDGTLDDRLMRHLGSVMATHERILKEKPTTNRFS